jgi:hypothetical protein
VYIYKNMEVWRRRDQSKKRWIDCVRQYMREMDISDQMTTDREQWKKKTCCADPKEIGTRTGR